MKGKLHIIVGVGLILLAVLIVLAVIFLPRMAAKSDMRKLLEKTAAPNAAYVMVVDPTFVHEGIMAGEGREARLEGETLSFVRNTLLTLAEDFSYEKKEGAFSGGLGLHLLVKDAEGEILQIYFAQEHFYATLKGARYYFTADDEGAYKALYESLQSALETSEK